MRYIVSALLALAFAGTSPAQIIPPKDPTPTATTNRAWIKQLGKFGHFIHRDKLKSGHPAASFAVSAVPATTLPVDWTANATVSCPILGNDTDGDCMLVMALHCDQVRTWMRGKGTQSQFTVSATLKDYHNLSGGDNGLDEGALLNGTGKYPGWLKGFASVPQVKIVDSLDIDVTNTALTLYAMDQGFDVCLMWSVPDDFLNRFDTGVVFDAPAKPNPQNGHGTPLIDAKTGYYRLWTWGSWCWVSNQYVAQVQPSAFVVFSTRGFDQATGLDAKGVHITKRAETWVTAGGKAIPASVISAFPPLVAPPVVAAPVITSARTATVQVGTAFTYQITASNAPTGFAVSALPAGLSMNSAGLISGKALTAGTASVTVSATNAGGTGSAIVAMTVTSRPIPIPPVAGGTITIKLPGQADVVYQIVPKGSKIVDPAEVKKLRDMLDRLMDAPAAPLPIKPSPIIPPKKAGLEEANKILAELERLTNRLDTTERRIASIPKLPLPAKYPLAPNTARLAVTVPADAVVTIHGEATSSTGPLRQYDSPPLVAGQDYTYRVVAEWQGGRASRVVTVRAGQVTPLDLTQQPQFAQSVK